MLLFFLFSSLLIHPDSSSLLFYLPFENDRYQEEQSQKRVYPIFYQKPLTLYLHMHLQYRLVKNFWQNVRYVWPDNIKRLISFFPSICSDWDFDAVPGIYRYLRVKLKRLEPCLRHGHLVGGVKYANQVRDVISYKPFYQSGELTITILKY